MRVALVHDWLNGMRGGEKVFEVLCELYPDADVFTLFYEPEKVSPTIRAMRVYESPAARWIPGARKRYRYLLPILPKLAEALPIRGYDLIISTSHCVAKGVKPEPAETPHICYCFTPMRYIWEKYDDYFGHGKGFAAQAMPWFRPALQRWDVESAQRVTRFLTSSEYVRERIQRNYGRDAKVVPPPVDCDRFAAVERRPEDYFLVLSALEPYKRVDLAVEAFARLGLPLKVAGSGSQAERLRRDAPPNIEFLGWVADEKLPQLLAGARALVFPADEDFGIVPLEAAAAGCPTIAYGHGGSLETVRDGKDGRAATGVFFGEQTCQALVDAVGAFSVAEESGRFRPEDLREWAQTFARARFKQSLAEDLRWSPFIGQKF